MNLEILCRFWVVSVFPLKENLSKLIVLLCCCRCEDRHACNHVKKVSLGGL